MATSTSTRCAAHAEFPGVEVDRQEAWGLVARLPGTGDGPALMLNGHIDVVPIGDPNAWVDPPFAGGTRDGHVYGRGACDMKAGLVASIHAMDALRTSGVRLAGDVILASVQGEEDGGLGTFALLQRGWRADACVVAEPTELDVIPANSGSLTFRLRVPGQATHAARRTEGVSAIEKFWPVWQALVELEQRRHEVVDPLMSRWRLAHPLSIGTVTAGDWASSVPTCSSPRGGWASPWARAWSTPAPSSSRPSPTSTSVIRGIASIPSSSSGGAGSSLPDGCQPAATSSTEYAPPMRSARATRDDHQRVYGAPYGSDLRLLTGLGGIPTVQYGPGDVRLAHGPRECVPIADIVTTARTLALLALDVCGEG